MTVHAPFDKFRVTSTVEERHAKPWGLTPFPASARGVCPRSNRDQACRSNLSASAVRVLVNNSEIGSQGVVSEILSGKRDLNVRQITQPAARFGVSPALFMLVPKKASTRPSGAKLSNDPASLISGVLADAVKTLPNNVLRTGQADTPHLTLDGHLTMRYLYLCILSRGNASTTSRKPIRTREFRYNTGSRLCVRPTMRPSPTCEKHSLRLIK